MVSHVTCVEEEPSYFGMLTCIVLKCVHFSFTRIITHIFANISKSWLDKNMIYNLYIYIYFYSLFFLLYYTSISEYFWPFRTFESRIRIQTLCKSYSMFVLCS